MMIKYFPLLFSLVLIPSVVAQQAPPLQHGVVIAKHYQISDYWVSEKLDGVRGYWNGYQLLTRQGNRIATPSWFTKDWPPVALDGELWSQRGEFEAIVSCVKSSAVDNPCWHSIKFMIFDLPSHTGIFTERVSAMKAIITASQSPSLKMISQERIPSKQVLDTLLNDVIANGGEGLMLHHQDAHYRTGRQKGLMKLKPYQDAEAKVLAHYSGKGKYQNMLGALLVETEDGVRFKIGTGFSDQQRQHPPAIGSTITYKYNGKTARGVPRFASFIRTRN